MTPTTTQQLDAKAKAMALAIRENESGGDYNSQGASGEWGAYQFMPDTWMAYSKEAGVNAPFGSATPEQQNEVAYKKIKQWKDQGYNPGQIASMWNAGPGKPNAYLEGNKGVNSKGVAYDTKTYAEKVAASYQRLKGQTELEMRTPNITPTGEPTLMGDLGATSAQAGSEIAQAVDKGFKGEINPASALLQATGGAAEGIVGALGDVIHHTPIVKDAAAGAEALVGAVAKPIIETEGVQGLIKNYQGWAEQHPEAAGNVEAVSDIASFLPAYKGVGMVKNKALSAADNALHGSSDPVLDMVGRHLTPKEKADSVSRLGTEKKGLLREIRIKDDPRDIKIADTVESLVPGVRPDKGLTHNISLIQDKATELKNELQSKVELLGKDRIYSYRELGSMLKKLEVPDVIAESGYLSRLHNRLVDHAIRIAKEKGGKVPNLLSVRQEFDRIVKKQYPNVWSSLDKTSPLKESVRNIRDALTKFTADNLPKEAGLKPALLQQHYLLEAIENMAEKATKGKTNEIGLDAIDRLGKAHPTVKGLLKASGGALMQGLGVGGVLKILD